MKGLLVVLVFWMCPLLVYGGQPPLLQPAGIVQKEKAVYLEILIGILEGYFKKMNPDKKLRVEVTDLRGYEKVTVPPGILSFDVVVPGQAQRGGSMTGVIRFLVNGQEVRRLRVSARIDLYVDVVSTSHYLKKHQEIQRRDVQWVSRNLAQLPQDAITDLDEILGKRTSLSINAHELLRAGMVEVPPLVKRGDRVTLLVENAQFRITALGEVKEDGRKGDRIRLLNLSSKREVYGRVVDPNTIQIDF